MEQGPDEVFAIRGSRQSQGQEQGRVQGNAYTGRNHHCGDVCRGRRPQVGSNLQNVGRSGRDRQDEGNDKFEVLEGYHNALVLQLHTSAQKIDENGVDQRNECDEA